MHQLKRLQSGSELHSLTFGWNNLPELKSVGIHQFTGRDGLSPKLVLDVLLDHCLSSESYQDFSGLLIVWVCYFLLRGKCAFLSFRLFK